MKESSFETTKHEEQMLDDCFNEWILEMPPKTRSSNLTKKYEIAKSEAKPIVRTISRSSTKDFSTNEPMASYSDVKYRPSSANLVTPTSIPVVKFEKTNQERYGIVSAKAKFRKTPILLNKSKENVVLRDDRVKYPWRNYK